MCGRFARSSPPEVFAQLMQAELRTTAVASYNIAPSQDLLAARVGADGIRELVLLHWGFVPHWSKGPDPKYSMINARADSVATKPAYRMPLRQRRCLISADGFYEWKADGPGKQPYFIRLRHGQPFAFAGLWDRWEGEGHAPIESCTILTCETNPLVATIHDRSRGLRPALASRSVQGRSSV